MMFLMLGDNVAHALFNIWRLPQLLRLCNTKFQFIHFHNQNLHFPKKKYSHNQCPTTTKNQCPTKISPQSKLFTYLYTTTKFFHSHAKDKNSHKFSHSQNHNHTNSPRINIPYLTKFFHKFHTPQNFSISTNMSMHIPTKFCHVHKTKFTYTNKLFPHTP